MSSEYTAVSWCPLRARAWLGAVEALRHEARRQQTGFWWLDSARPDPRLGRYSFAGADPYFIARAWGDRFEAVVRRAVRPRFGVGRSTRLGDPFDLLEDLLPQRPGGPDDPPLPFLGGAVGYFGYELAAQLEDLELSGRDDLGLPDLCFLGVDRLIAFDHLEDRMFVVALGFASDPALAQHRADTARDALHELTEGDAEGDARSTSSETPRRAFPNLSNERPPPPSAREAYEKAVRWAIDSIEAGDVYQVCLTHRLELESDADPFQLYGVLRRENPAPFAAYLDLPDVKILSSSPERFLSLGADRWAESRPIKGTRPRDVDPGRDRALARELAASEKDGAENLMIVDLVRNDFGRVCETGSVHVPELRVVEPFATVFQMVSTVRGRLRAECSRSDLLRASFPPGSMTGAPKIAAMRILDGLEPVRRGVYSGALGFLDVRGGAGLSVVIRTALVKGRRVLVHVGGGVVADSDPGEEWQESLDKARALLQAVEIARLSGGPAPR